MGRLAAAWLTEASPEGGGLLINVEHATRHRQLASDWGTSGIGKQGSGMPQACKRRSMQQSSVRATSPAEASQTSADCHTMTA